MTGGHLHYFLLQELGATEYIEREKVLTGAQLQEKIRVAAQALKR